MTTDEKPEEEDGEEQKAVEDAEEGTKQGGSEMKQGKKWERLVRKARTLQKASDEE